MFVLDASRYIKAGKDELALMCVENALCCRSLSKRDVDDLSNLANELAVTLAERNFK
jgi:hypothetical protein